VHLKKAGIFLGKLLKVVVSLMSLCGLAWVMYMQNVGAKPIDLTFCLSSVNYQPGSFSGWRHAVLCLDD
jgi:hypothetical protein